MGWENLEWRGCCRPLGHPKPSWPVQISRFLVVDPRQRYTAGEALAHPFFQQYDVEEVRHFSPFRKFKVRMRLGAAGASTAMGFPAGAGFLGG